MRDVRATSMAFAALRGDGRVVVWGDDFSGGNKKASQHAENPV